MGFKITVDSDCSYEIKRCLLLGRKAMTNLDSTLKLTDVTLPTKVWIIKGRLFPVVMYRCESWDRKGGWAPRNWYFRTAVLEKTPESPLESKGIKPVNTKGNQLWILIGRTNVEAPILWPPDVKSWLIGKDPDAGKDWKQEKGVAMEEMVGWNHQLNGHEFEQTPGDGDGQGNVAWCSPWGGKESHMI